MDHCALVSQKFAAILVQRFDKKAQHFVSIQDQVVAVVYGAECHTKYFECYDNTFSRD